MASEKMKVKLYDTNYTISGIEISHYRADNSVAIQLYSWCKDYGGFNEPFAMLTVCLNNPNLKENEAYLDTNNCRWGEEFVAKYELGKPTGEYQSSGFCTYPLYEWNLEKLSQYEMEVLE